MEKRVYLSEEIISQIITSSRLDLKSLILCMGVCKLWRNLVSDHISDDSFVPKGRFLVYDYTQRRFGALDDETNHIAWMYGEPRLKRAPSFMWPCNGLVSLMAAHGCGDIYVSNPLTGEYISVPGPQPLAYMSSLGFCSSSNEYKLTCFTSRTLEIRTLGSSGWRSVPFENQNLCNMWRAAVCVNGVFHWLLKAQSILTFDLTTEVLGTIHLSRLGYGKKIYQLSCMDHCLVVTAGYERPSGLDIWVREEDKSSGGSVWTKNWVIDAAQMLVPNDLQLLVPHKLSTDGCVIMGDHGDNLWSYDSRNKLVRPLWHCGDDRMVHSYFTPTLVSPKKLMLKKRRTRMVED